VHLQENAEQLLRERYRSSIPMMISMLGPSLTIMTWELGELREVPALIIMMALLASLSWLE
jgi:hypothetical protein